MLVYEPLIFLNKGLIKVYHHPKRTTCVSMVVEFQDNTYIYISLYAFKDICTYNTNPDFPRKRMVQLPHEVEASFEATSSKSHKWSFNSYKWPDINK